MGRGAFGIGDFIMIICKGMTVMCSVISTDPRKQD